MKKLMYYFLAAIFGVVTITACSSDDDDKLPTIDGYNSSDEVAASSLKAHWTFDDTNNEAISSASPSNTFGTVGFTSGQIGSALKLTQGALVYPSLSAFNDENALNSFTVSMWVNIANNKGAANQGFSCLFALIPTSVSDIWGDVVAGAETGNYIPASDTLVLKNLLNTHSSGSNNYQDNIAVKSDNGGTFFKGASKWVLYTQTWDATTHQYMIYANGTSVGGYSDRGTTGSLVMATPVKPVFGSVASTDIGFEDSKAQAYPWATASIDDVRVFNTVLSQAEVTALFNLGTAGR